jgi:hypothetical protein
MLPSEFHCRVPGTVGKNIRNFLNEKWEDPCVHCIQGLIIIKAVGGGGGWDEVQKAEQRSLKGTEEKLPNSRTASFQTGSYFFHQSEVHYLRLTRIPSAFLGQIARCFYIELQTDIVGSSKLRMPDQKWLEYTQSQVTCPSSQTYPETWSKKPIA